ncbi:hypothetical protein MAM1_0088d04793 [Mucor ambiguus]|uniref:Uncharacterized protein n=1 Tax=Mucor ambiguus TaxID=91626 RepID=A0A0C9MTE5_9FUNG|nr:hypothetical protein MAM1_0088d04793 [Mucor ambiguus]
MLTFCVHTYLNLRCIRPSITETASNSHATQSAKPSPHLGGTSPVRRSLMIYRFNNRTSRATQRYFPERYRRFPLDFYYNKDNGNIIYGRQMIYHYKQHPPHEHYVHVSNFMQELYSIYQDSCKGLPQTQDVIMLCSAITSFLTKIYPSEISHEGEASTTQYAFILPSQEYTNRRFIDATLRPLLLATPWLTLGDLASKTVFYDKIDTYVYQLDDFTQYGFCLERERKYLFCTLRKINNQRRLMLTMRFIRAVYDPDLIAASGRSMTALGGNTILSSKMISPPSSLDIPIEPAIAKVNTLAELFYNNIFAGEEEDSSPTELDKYYTKSDHRSLIHNLIKCVLMSNSMDTWTREIITKDILDRAWSTVLSENMMTSLSRITCGDIIQVFDDVDVASLESEIRHYLQKHGDEEYFQSIIMVEEEERENVYMELNHCKNPNFAFAEEQCQRLYLLRVQNAIACFLDQIKETEACVYKILNMVQLSSRLGRPIVMNPVGEVRQESSKAPAIQKEKLALIDRIQPYGYYVEANISRSYGIKMSLNQVIETTIKDGKLQKSTISIMDSSYQAPDMYDSIFGALWNIIAEHSASPQCKSLNEDEPVDFDGYKIVRADLIDVLKSSMENKSNVIYDLDEMIYTLNTELNCTCDFMITHRLVIGVGLLPYLRCIAGEIVASLKSNAIFGNYKVSCLLVTGEFLYKWLEQRNATYGELVWNQLQEAINSKLADKQLRVQLMMKKYIVLEDNNLSYKPLKLERYRQVLSKQYYLKILYYGQKTPQVYQDKGDNWVKISSVSQDDNLTWITPLLPNEDKEHSKYSLEEKFYAIDDPEDTFIVYWETSLIVLPTTELNNVDASRMNVALMTHLDSFRFYADISKARRTFPIEVMVMPCSYLSAIDLKLRMGIDASANDPLRYDHVAYSERLALQKI